jgi:integrase
VERTAPETFLTRDAADAWLSTVRADLYRGTWRAPETGDVALPEYFETWLSNRHDLAPRTVALYRNLASRWIFRRLGLGRGIDLCLVSVRGLTPTLVREWHAAVVVESQASATARRDRANTGRLHRGHPARAWARASGVDVAPTGRLAPSVLAAWESAGQPMLMPTDDARADRAVPSSDAGGSPPGRTQAAQAYRLLHAVLATAVRDEFVEQNPCRVDGATVVRHPERRPAAPAEVAALAEVVPAHYRAAVLLAAWSGLRAGELFGLARRHVDLEVGAVRVERALIELRGAPISFGPPKSHAGRRTVHVPRLVIEALATHLEEYTGPDAYDLIFTTPTGKPVGAAQRSAFFSPARSAVGRPDLRWHDLRHTGAVLAAQTGASLAELQRRLGHSTVRAALIYQHAADDRDQLLARRLDDLVLESATA